MKWMTQKRHRKIPKNGKEVFFLINNILVNQPDLNDESKKASEALASDLKRAETRADKEGWLSDNEIIKIMGLETQ